MVAVVKPDKLEALGRVNETPRGLQVTRSFGVSGLTAATEAARILEAHNAPGVPIYGAPHPSETALLCLDKTTQLETADPTQAVVTCLYRVPEPGEVPGSGGASDAKWELDSSVTSESTSTDKDGNRMVAVYSGNPSNLPPGVWTTKHELFEIGVLRPRMALRFSRTETGMPDQLANKHTGKVNQFEIWANPPYPARTLLLAAVRAPQVDFALNRYLVTYEFFYDAAGWDYVGRVTINGSVPDDAGPGNGIETFETYQESDFSELNIPSPN